MSSTLSTSLGNKGVRRNDKYKDVVNLLVYGSLDGKSGGLKPFDNIKDLIIFAAMVGMQFETTEDVDPSNHTSITLGTFSGAGSRGTRVGQHDIIFMFGLLLKKDIIAIKDENLSDSIALFEQYSNGGLSMIHDWLVAAAWNPLTLEQVLLDFVASSSTSGIRVEGGNPF